jgi:hypothetical protein
MERCVRFRRWVMALKLTSPAFDDAASLKARPHPLPGPAKNGTLNRAGRLAAANFPFIDMKRIGETGWCASA